MQVELGMRPQWVFSLGTEELHLALKGLRGDLSGEDVAKAMQLHDKLNTLRVTALRQAGEQAGRLERQLGKKELTPANPWGEVVT